MLCQPLSPNLAFTDRWRPAPQTLRAEADQVHLWLFALNQPFSCLEQLEASLSPDEIARADRFRFPHLRQHYISGRGIMRDILGRYLQQAPASITFTYEVHGKPEIAAAPIPLRFNLSHSGELGLLGVALGRQVGVDIEFMRPMEDLHSIAEAYFSPREIEDLRALPEGQQARGFFNAWTRKEAYLKGIGKGLAQALNAFDVSLKPGEPAQFIAMRENPAEKERWCLQDIPVGPAYAAALIAEGQDWSWQGWQWSVGA